MLPQVRPFSGEGERDVSALLEIFLHVGGINPMRRPRVQSVLDARGLGHRIRRATVLLPVLHHHGDAGRTTAVLLLFYKWDVEPKAGRFTGEKHTSDPQHQDDGS